MSKARFETELLEGHKGVLCVVVPFDPETTWERKPARLAGRRHGWPIKGTLNRVRFEGFVGDRWGKFFVIVAPELREEAGVEVGEVVSLVIEPTSSASTLAKAREQSKLTTQPGEARTDVVEDTDPDVRGAGRRPRRSSPGPRGARSTRRA